MLNIPFYKIILLSLLLLITIDLSNSKSLESKFNVDPIDDIGKEIKHFEETTGRHVFNLDPIDEIGKEIKHVEETTGRHLFNVEVLDVFVEGHVKNAENSSADLTDYINWLLKEQKTSRLERFRQLQAEILLLEKQTESYYDDERPIRTKKMNEINNQLSEKVSRVIEEIEWDEIKRRSKEDL